MTCSSNNPQICLVCDNGLYMSNGVCMPCDITCQTCSSSNPSNCSTCYPNTFQNGSTCISCSSNCLTCIGISATSNCTSCYPGYSLFLGTCIQGCPMNCLTCSFSENCTMCENGYTLFNQTSDNYTQTVCVPCTTNCRGCALGQPASCISAGAGFYLLGNTSIACTTNCKTCNAEGCQSCLSGFFLTPSLTCSVNCQLPCATCSANSPTKCSSCIAGYFYNSMSYSCSPQPTCAGACSVCPIGYLLQNGNCLQCSTPNCQLCNSNNLTQCVSCSPGYYLSSKSNVCNPCQSQCSTCLRNSTCLTCASGYTSISQSLINSQVGGVQCLPCTFPCLTC